MVCPQETARADSSYPYVRLRKWSFQHFNRRKEKKMKRIRINTVVGRLLPAFVLVCSAVLLAGCVGLSVRVVTCPVNKAICEDDELRESEYKSEPYLVSKTFVILVTHGQGQISSVSATVTDDRTPPNTVKIDPVDIYKPNTHTLIDPSYWAVRIDWAKLSSQGLRVGTGGSRWTVDIDTVWDSKQDTMTLKFDVTD
jgi:hypothetical protein